MLVDALKTQFAPAPMIELLLIGARYADLCPRIDEVCAQYVDDFEKNIESYSRQNGFNMRLEGIRLALIRLQNVAQSKGQTELAQKYSLQRDEYENQREYVLNTKRW